MLQTDSTIINRGFWGNMLNRLESAYLSILRVVILVAATLALVVAAFAMIASAPFFASQLGISGELEGGGLAQFVEEQRGYEGTAQSYGSDDDYSRSYTISASLQASARRLANYAKTHHDFDISVSQLEQSLAASQEQFPLEYYGDYEDSVERLSKELENAEGTPLSMEKLDELTQWHDQNFRMAVAEKEAAKGEELMGAITAFGTAGGAFLVFVFLVFCFLFVRIERNLRVVHVANAQSEIDYEE